MARKEAILSQAPEFFGMRSTKFRDAIITYDLVTIALSRIRNFKILRNMLENSMKFSFNEPHTWTQFGLALASEGQCLRSLTVFNELADRNQADAGTCLAVARMCYEVLNKCDAGLEWSKRALRKDSSTPDHFLKGKCNIFIGIGCLLKARTLESNVNRHQQQYQAEEHFLEAQATDPMDHLSEFYLAYHYAECRNITKALKHVRRALDLHPEHLPSLHLMILLLSAQDEYEESLETTIMTLEEYPDSFPILSLRVRLEEKVNGTESAILTAKGMLKKWQQATENCQNDVTDHTNPRLPSGALGTPFAGTTSFDKLNGYASSRNPAFDALSDKDSISLHAHSVTASHVEKTLSEVASSLSVPFPRLGPHDPAYTQMRIWLLTAELHLNQNNIPEAENCLNEARMMSPLSYHLMFTKGLIGEKKGDLQLAKHCFENSLGVNPSHVSSLHHLGYVYYTLGFNRLSEQALKIAVKIDPSNDEIWTLLGEVEEAIAKEILVMADDLCEPSRPLDEDEKTPTEATGQSLFDESTRLFQRSAECQAIALKLISSSPILPFTSIPFCFD